MRVVGLAVVLLFAATSVAQPRDVQKADALFREGRSALKAGDLDTACPKLEESYRLDPAAGAAVSLGDCFEKQGKIGSALLAYRSARTLLTAEDPRLTPVNLHIAALEKRAPKLTIALAPDAPEGTIVTRDGKVVQPSALGTSMHLNPGEVNVVVSAPGREDVRHRFTLVEGELRELVAIPGELSDGASSAAANHASAGRPVSTGLILVGIGVAGVGTGMAAALMADSKQSIVDDNCDANKVCNQEGFDAAESGKTLTTISYIGWGVGLAGLAAGGYLLLFREAREEPRTSVSAMAHSDGGAVALRGRFW